MGQYGKRPTVLEEDPARVQALIDCLRRGNFRSVACRLAGISPITFRRWLRDGLRDEKKGLDTKYVRVRYAVLQAEAEAVDGCVSTIDAAKSEDWKAAAWLLKHGTAKEMFRKAPTQTEVTGKDGGPIETKRLENLSDEAIDELLATYEGREDSEAGEGEGHTS